MDNRRFDRWTQSLTDRLSRRGLGRLIGILAALGVEALAADEVFAASRKRRKQRHRDRQREANAQPAQVSAEKKKMKR